MASAGLETVACAVCVQPWDNVACAVCAGLGTVALVIRADVEQIAIALFVGASWQLQLHYFAVYFRCIYSFLTILHRVY